MCGRHDGRGLMVLLICVEVVVMDLGVPGRVCWCVAGIGFVLVIFVCGVFCFISHSSNINIHLYLDALFLY